MKKSELRDDRRCGCGATSRCNEFGEVLGVYRILAVLTERKEARTCGKYAEIEPADYTDEDDERIDAIYESERPRGVEKRYWEDVDVGDVLRPW